MTLPLNTKDYIFEKKLGKGSFSDVFLAHLARDPSVKVAIKMIHLPSQKVPTKQIDEEISIQSEFKHQNLVSLLDVFVYPPASPEYRCIVLEYMAGGDLGDKLSPPIHASPTGQLRRPPPERIPEHIVQRLARQLCDGLYYLHSHNILHRDLKPSNLMLTDPDLALATLKICDFGFAKQLEPSQLTQSLVGTPYYLAPELVKGNPYDLMVDIWSVGIILYELLVGTPPLRPSGAPDINPLSELCRMLKDPHLRVDFSSCHALGISAECVDFLSRLLVADPAKRARWDEILRHPWLNTQRQKSPLFSRVPYSFASSPPVSFLAGISNSNPSSSISSSSSSSSTSPSTASTTSTTSTSPSSSSAKPASPPASRFQPHRPFPSRSPPEGALGYPPSQLSSSPSSGHFFPQSAPIPAGAPPHHPVGHYGSSPLDRHPAAFHYASTPPQHPAYPELPADPAPHPHHMPQFDQISVFSPPKPAPYLSPDLPAAPSPYQVIPRYGYQQGAAADVGSSYPPPHHSAVPSHFSRQHPAAQPHAPHSPLHAIQDNSYPPRYPSDPQFPARQGPATPAALVPAPTGHTRPRSFSMGVITRETTPSPVNYTGFQPAAAVEHAYSPQSALLQQMHGDMRALLPPKHVAEAFHPTEALPTPEPLYHRALVLIEVADVCVEQKLVLEALTLILNALDYVNQTRRFFAAHPEMRPLNLPLDQVEQKYRDLLVKGESLYRSYALKPAFDPSHSKASALNQQIYSYAMQLGRTAAVAEEMEMWIQAAEQYQKGLLLLKHLVSTTSDTHASQLDRLIQGFQLRLTTVSKHC